jgi:hypothetical protein
MLSFGREREIRRRERRKGIQYRLVEDDSKTNEAIQLEPVYLEKNHRRQIRLDFFLKVWAFPGLFLSFIFHQFSNTIQYYLVISCPLVMLP